MPRPRPLSPAWAVVLLLVTFASSAPAQDKAPLRATKDERSARVDEALRLSDLKGHLLAIRSRLLGYLDATRTSDQTRQWAAGGLTTVYAPDVYVKLMKRALLDDYRDEAMTRVLSWYRSPAGRKITRLENAAQVTGQGPARRKYLAGLEERQPSDYRLVLIWSVDEASRTSAATASALRASINGWSLGIEQLGEGQEVREIEAAIRTYRAELRDDVADDVLRELMYAYRDASDGDLRAYAEFLESGAGRWFIGTAFKSHQAYFEGAADQVAEDLVTTATSRRYTRPPQTNERARPSAAPGPSLPARR